MDLGKLLDEIESACVSGSDPHQIVLDVRGIVERTRESERPDESPVYVRESAAREARERELEAAGVSQAEARREETAAKEAAREAEARERGEFGPTPAETVARLEEELAPPPAPEPEPEPLDVDPEPLPLPEEPVVPPEPVAEGDEEPDA